MCWHAVILNILNIIIHYAHHITPTRLKTDFSYTPLPLSMLVLIRRPTKEFWTELSVQPTLNGGRGDVSTISSGVVAIVPGLYTKTKHHVAIKY